jgi:hypothetical protein
VTEQIRPLELLHRVAAQMHATVCLTSSADTRNTTTGRRLRTLEPGASLTRLLVVKPAPYGPDRWIRIARGTVLAQENLDPLSILDDVALVVVRQLVRRHRAERRRAA